LFTNVPEFEYGIIGHSIPSDVWDGVIEPVFEIQSYCAELTSLDIEYSVNDGTVHTYEWTGSLTYGQSAEVTLPEIQFDILDENELVINILNEDDSPEDNSLTVNFTHAPGTANNELVVQVRTDQWGSETTWNITTEEGTVVANGGPYTNAANTHNHDITIIAGNYTLTINDSYGDGIVGGGYIRILDDGQIMVNIPGNSFTSTASRKFRVLEQNLTVDFDIEDDSEIDIDGLVNIYFNVPVTHTDGSEITNEDVEQLITYSPVNSDKENVAFTATISEDKKHIHIEPLDVLAFSTTYMVELAPVMAPDQTLTEPVSIVFTTRSSYGAPVATFNVLEEETDVPVDHTFEIEFNQPVRHANGSTITVVNIGQLITFSKDNLQGDNVPYSASINSEKTIITINPLSNLAGSQMFVLGVDALMGYDDEISEFVHVSFTTEEALFVNTFDPATIQIYPNPARSQIFVELPPVSGEVSIRFFDVSGQLVYSSNTYGQYVNIDSSQFSSGLYFVEIIADGKVARRKITVAE